MSKWVVHNKWVCKMGIASQIADYMQKAIDSKGPTDKKVKMPEDFLKHCEDKKIVVHRHKNFAIADLIYNMHDRAKGKRTLGKIIQGEDLKFLLLKGEDYVKAYCLHFILDYLVSMDFWMETTHDTVLVCIDKYMKNKAVVIEGTPQSLLAVVGFLKANSDELQVDYNLK